jgi:16S rRNA (guanine(966)-N(2))-methyltransferase RsmD
MRIIGGKYGSRPLRSLRGRELRPTSDRLRETLFNILGPAVQGSVFVDLYAGTGAVGIEALSRGADEVIFVEKHAAAVKLIRSNLRSLGIAQPEDRPARPWLVGSAPAAEAAVRGQTVRFPGNESRVEVLAADAVKALAALQRRKLLADFIFLDPPYSATPEYERALDALSTAHLLAPAGRLIVEMARAAKRPPARREPATPLSVPRIADRAMRTAAWTPPERIGALEQTRIVEQGDSLLVFYRLALAA